MTGPVYYSIWLFCGTLYPAYESFKAVKAKNAKNYVRWMMYWIVYAIFGALESIVDPIMNFWLPFYSEAKILFLLYLVSSSTRGSTNIYRAWVHPTLSENEAEIDIAINKFKSKTVQTIKQWVTTGLQRLGGVVTQTAISGGGGLMQSFQKSYSMMDLSEPETRVRRREYRNSVIMEDDNESGIGASIKSYKSEEYLSHNNPTYASLARLRVAGGNPDLIKSSESLSSGYSTDNFLPSSHELREESRPGGSEVWEEKLDNIVRDLKSSKSRIEGGRRQPPDNPSLLNPFDE